MEVTNMPRNVRNFWIEMSVDGTRTNVATGPRAKDGGFSLTIRQRDKGSITKTAEISGRMLSNGKLRLQIDAVNGGDYSWDTER